jgi:hypothetical protein
MQRAQAPGHLFFYQDFAGKYLINLDFSLEVQG